MNCRSFDFWGPCCMRLFRGIARTVVLGILTGPAFAQNPVPQVVGPPSPQAVMPGGGNFTLKVYGANFVAGSVVNWNRQPRATIYISGDEVDATILSTDIASNTAGYITVTNPPPGGGVSSSSWTLVEVHDPTPTIAPSDPKLYLFKSGGPVAQLLVADFNNDGIMDLADANAVSRIPILLGDGAGMFAFKDMATFIYYTNFGISNVVDGDFNGDGNLDLAYVGYFGQNTPTGVYLALGNGDGNFKPGWHKDDPTWAAYQLLTGDFNGDGKLDLIVEYCCFMEVYLGNGDGTFSLFKTYKNKGFVGHLVAVADFNGDGKLDMLVQTDARPSPLWVVLGNGDGSFQKPQLITTYLGGGCTFGRDVQISDFNSDGRPDVAFCTPTSIGVMLNNGDGTFQKPKFYFADKQPQFTFTVGDFNSDGKTDLIVSEYTSLFDNPAHILLGNGDGTFQPKQYVPIKPKNASNGELGISVGDFNSDGLLDFIFLEGGYGFDEYLQK